MRIMFSSPPRAFAVYYLFGTLAFIATDLLLGTGALRVPGLAELGTRWGYYALLLGLGVAAWRWPASGAWLGAGESLLNLGLLIGGVLLPIWTLGDVIDTGGEPADAVLGPLSLLGTALAGACLLAGVYRTVLPRPPLHGSRPVP